MRWKTIRDSLLFDCYSTAVCFGQSSTSLTALRNLLFPLCLGSSFDVYLQAWYLVWRALLSNVWKILDSAKRIPYSPICLVMFNCSIQVTVLLSCLPWWIPNWCSCFDSLEIGMFSISSGKGLNLWNWPHEMKMTHWFITISKRSRNLQA